MTKITEHRFAHLSDRNMHEVKGFPSAAVNGAYQKNIRGTSQWKRLAKLDNVTGGQNGYNAPASENDGDVFIIESPELDVNGIVWQSGTTVRFTFSAGYSNIYAVGNYLQVSGETTQTVHNGVWLISAVNASFLEVTNANVTDGTNDVASASPATAYVTHQNFDPENLSNGQSIPRFGLVTYYADSDLWYGDELEKGDFWYNEVNDSFESWNGTAKTVGFKEYRVRLSQIGTGNPSTKGECGEITGVVHARIGIGAFIITKTGAFGIGTSVVFSGFGFFKVTEITDNFITYETFATTDSSTAVDGVMTNTGLIITVK